MSNKKHNNASWKQGKCFTCTNCQDNARYRYSMKPNDLGTCTINGKKVMPFDSCLSYQDKEMHYTSFNL